VGKEEISFPFFAGSKGIRLNAIESRKSRILVLARKEVNSL
jgi:hypothetical protein